MKKLLLLALLLLTMPALAQDSVRLKMARYHNSAYNGRCVVDATYPQIPGRSDLNEKLRALIPASSKPDESEEGTVLHIEQDFKVTYNAHGLVSVFGQGLSMTSKDGHPYQAHPNKLFDALTIDLKSGKAYSLRDMFGPDAYAKLDPLISQSAAKEIGSPVVLTEHTYHCYLSDKGVTFYQIFDNFAAGSVQVTIPYAQALPLANPGGPLMRLKKIAGAHDIAQKPSRVWRISLSLVLLMTMAAAADERMTQHLASLKKRLPGPGFRTTISAPFVVVGDLPADELEQYAQGTVGWASTRLKKLYFAKDPAEIIDVWLFKDAPSYERNVLKLTGSAPSTPFGFYSPARAGLFMNIHTGGGTLVHELVHPYVRANFPDCPDWFNEGLASLYEQCGDHQGKIWGYTNWRLAGLQKAIRSRSLGSFQRMAELTEGKFYQDERGSNYGQARYLCLYLQEEGKLSDFYHRFSASAAHDPSGLKTLRSVLQVEDLVEFQKTWENWVLRLKFEP